MKNKNYSVYATNKIGRILSPKGKPQGEPASTKNEGSDLRVKRG
jgi:hypothetical protein